MLLKEDSSLQNSVPYKILFLLQLDTKYILIIEYNWILSLNLINCTKYRMLWYTEQTAFNLIAL